MGDTRVEMIPSMGDTGVEMRHSEHLHDPPAGILTLKQGNSMNASTCVEEFVRTNSQKTLSLATVQNP